MEDRNNVLAEIHAIQLEMLKAVDVLCEKYNIRYSIYCGTLLGAVRHGGFIPWDDDIDLAMPLQDYRKFLQHADELPAGLFCVHRKNTRDYSFLWLKIMAEGTTFMNKNGVEIDVPPGISLDIYPMIGTPDSAFGKKIQKGLLFIAVRLQRAADYKVLHLPGCARKIIAHMPEVLRLAAIEFLLYFSLINPENCENIGTIDSVSFEGKFKRKDWSEMTKLRFEDAYFTAPVHYDRILRRMYGDYMKLPPEEKSTGHFDENKIIDPHRDYRLYRKELLGK